MKTIFTGQYFIALDSVDSTNDYMSNLLKNTSLPEGALVVADAQTAGKGQRGNNWISEAGKNLTASFVFYPRFMQATEQFGLNMMVSLAVHDALSEMGVEAVLKWPNDVLVDKQKIAGILIENTLKGSFIDHTIIGLGLNVNQLVFPDGLRAVSMRKLLGKEQVVAEVLKKVGSHLEKRYLQLQAGKEVQLQEEYESLLLGYLEVQNYCFKGENIEAEITGVDMHGRLELLSGEKVLTADFKEIVFIY